MSDQSDFISQIQNKEKEAERTLIAAEKSNGQRVVKATEEAAIVVADAEENAKKTGKEILLKKREDAKSEYKRVLVEFDNNRRDQIEGGKANLPKARKLAHESIINIFSTA